MVALLLESNTLGPVVKGAGHEDFGRRMSPSKDNDDENESLATVLRREEGEVLGCGGEGRKEASKQASKQVGYSLSGAMGVKDRRKQGAGINDGT